MTNTRKLINKLLEIINAKEELIDLLADNIPEDKRSEIMEDVKVLMDKIKTLQEESYKLAQS